MKSTIIDKIKIYEQFQGIMEQHSGEWSQVQQFKADYDEFVSNLIVLNESKSIYEMDINDLESDLIKQKKELKTKFNLMLRLLQLYAEDNRKTKLIKKVEKIRERLGSLLKTELSKMVMEICDFAEKKLDPELQEDMNLSGYAVSIEMINGLRETCETYLKNWEILKQENVRIRKAGKEIDKRILKNDLILKNRVKKFMVIYKKTNPDFYQAVKNVLKIIKEKKEEKIQEI